MKLWFDVGMFTLRRIQSSLRNPVFLFMGIAVPIVYLALFAPLLKTLIGASTISSVLALFVPGMLPIIAFNTGLFTGFSMIDEVLAGVIERFRVTPVSRFAILFGPVLFNVCTTLVQSLLFILIALPFGFRPNLLGMFLLFILLALLTCITSTFGNALSIIVKSDEKYAPIVHGINLPILLLSGTLLPMSLAPTWLSALAHCNPVFYTVEAARALALGDFASINVVLAFAILIPFAIMTTAWATKVFRKAIT